MKQFVAEDYDSRAVEAARRVLLELTPTRIRSM